MRGGTSVFLPALPVVEVFAREVMPHIR